MGRKKKLLHFTDNVTFPNFFQPNYDDMKQGFELKGNWKKQYFGNNLPLILELGCGKGEYTVGLATRHPEMNFIGVDLKGARMWKGARDSIEMDLDNVAFLRIRIEHLLFCFDYYEIDEIWITFPDPQPRMKQRKKRLTSPRFLQMYSTIMKDGGVLHVKTDSFDFYKFTLDLLPQFRYEVDFKTEDLYRSGWKGEASEIQTFYEKKFLEQGSVVKYLKAHLQKSDRKKPQPQDKGSFFQQVYDVVRLIPFGRVTSYGAIAEYLGSRGSARMVGWAMNASHSSDMPVPAHRVVNRNGMLTGKNHFGDPTFMEQLLKSEGVFVINDRVKDFEKYFWDPSAEL